MEKSVITETYQADNNEEDSLYYNQTEIFSMYDMLDGAFDNLSDIEPSLTIIRTR